MPHKPDPEKGLSVKTKLLLIAVMFVIVNLIFYVGFDSDESEQSVELDEENQSNVENTKPEEETIISLAP